MLSANRPQPARVKVALAVLIHDVWGPGLGVAWGSEETGTATAVTVPTTHYAIYRHLPDVGEAQTPMMRLIMVVEADTLPMGVYISVEPWMTQRRLPITVMSIGSEIGECCLSATAEIVLPENVLPTPFAA